MYLRATEVLPNGSINLSEEAMQKMKLSTGDYVSLIYDNGRIIVRKLTHGEGKMTFDEFLLYRDIKIKSISQEKIARLLYVYLGSVTGDNRLLPDLIGQLIGIDVSSLTVPSCCHNNIFENTPPYEDTDWFIKLSNDIRIYMYGKIQTKPLRELQDNEYVIFILSDDFNCEIERTANRHIYLR